MKKINNIKLAIGILILFLLGLSACQHRGDRHLSELDHGKRLTGHIVSELDLTSAQEILLNNIVSDLEETKQELDDRGELKRLFVSQLKSEELDEEYLRQETGRLIRELESAADRFITGFGTFHASLNAEQRAKFSEFAGRRTHNRKRHN